MILMDVEDVLQAIAVVEHEYKTKKGAPGAGKSDPETAKLTDAGMLINKSGMEK